MEVLGLIFAACLIGAGIIFISAIKRGHQEAAYYEEEQLEAEQEALAAARSVAQRRRRIWRAIDDLYEAFQERVREHEQTFLELKEPEASGQFPSISLAQIDAAFQQFTDERARKSS